MKTRTMFSAIAFGPMLLSAETRLPAADAFKQLTSLVGTWEGRFPDGRAHTVSYRLTAGGSVLVETWTLGPSRESMTLYSIDGGDLIATHYCPQGNQPRLRLVAANDPTRLSFELVDGGNLRVPGKSHQHAFWLKVDGPSAFTRSETYVDNGSTPADIAGAKAEDAVAYSRVPPTR